MSAPYEDPAPTAHPKQARQDALLTRLRVGTNGGLRLEIGMLGPLQVLVGGAMAEFRTDAERALLAYLAAYQGSPQRRDTLAGLLSPDRADAEALTYLRNRLTRLRSAISDEAVDPPWLDLDRKQISLRNSDAITVDVTRFERLLTTVERHAHRQLAGCPSCLTALQEAEKLARGEFLAGLNFPSETWQSWLAAQREHYQLRVLEAMTLLREAHLARGEWAAALAIAQRQLSLEAWLEAAHRAMMLAYSQLGERNAALAQYDQCAQLLWDELGVEPELETQQLRQQIADDALVVGERASAPDNLPPQHGPFFGRRDEQAQLLQRLVSPDYRLMTIVGAGGIGKTRLAIELGRQVKASFPDGVWFVALEAISGGAEQIMIAIGEALGLAQHGKQLTGDQVLAILRGWQALLILDNCETLLDDLAFLPEWLRRAPQLAMLATSREPLNFQAESVLLLGSLPSGSTAAGEAEALFAERGRMAWDGFALTAENLPLVRQICTLVDGSPLGIALAAAWVRRRSLTQIRDEIGHSLDFLSTRLRDVDPRHRSMRAVFETSWQLLSPKEQEILAALSVFPATFSPEAATTVARATLPDLDRLCETSLLQQQHEPERYLMHSLLRQFAADKLAERTPAVDHAFTDYYHRFAVGQQQNYAALEPEWRNCAAAVTKAHALHDWQRVLDLVQVLDEPWFRQIRFSDMRQGLALALDAANELQDRETRARTLLRLGEIELEQNDYSVAEAHLTDALHAFTRLEETSGIAQATYLLGRIRNEQAQDDQALELFEASKRLFEEERDWLGVAKNLNLIAVSHVKKYRDFHAAQTYLEQSLALQQPLAVSATSVETLRNLARVTGWSDNYATAEQYLAEAATRSRQLGDLGEYAAVLYEQLLLCKRQQRFDQALEYGYECLESFRKLGSLRWEALIKTQLGLLLQAKQELNQGLGFLNEGLQLFHELGDIYEQAYSYYYMYRLYAERGDPELSLQAKRHAQRLNQELNDPQLHERLA